MKLFVFYIVNNNSNIDNQNSVRMFANKIHRIFNCLNTNILEHSTLRHKMAECFDVIVIGAGIEGSATAYNLSKNKKRILLLEQVRLRRLV